MRGVPVSESLIATNSFACTMVMDLSMVEGKDMEKPELYVYGTKERKIVSEPFFM